MKANIMKTPYNLEPIAKDAALDALGTLSRPLVTLLDNFRGGQIDAKNKATTFEAMDKAIEMLRVAYINIKYSD